MALKDEQRILGCLVVDSAAIGKCSNLTPDMFSDSAAKLMFQAIKVLSEKNKTVTYQAIVNTCDGKLSADYIELCLKEYSEVIYSPTLEIKDYADAIIGDYNKRVLTDVAKDLHEAKITRLNFAEIKQNLINKLTIIPDNADYDNPSMEALINENENLLFRKRDKHYLYFGMKNLDNYVGGLEGGDVAIIAARPSVGKSAFANQIIVNCCRRGMKVGLFNVELTKAQVYYRFLSHVSGIELPRIRNATAFQNNEEELFNKANAEMRKYRLNIHCGDITIEKIKSLAELNKYDVIFIDYLQLVSINGKFSSRNEEVGRLSKFIKGIAMKNNIPVIALSQLNRNHDEDKEPSLVSLGESGKIEQDASVIIFLWNKDGDKSKKGIKVAKSRNGETGKGLLTFEGAKMKFTEINTKREQTVMPDANGFEVADPNDIPFFG